MRYRVGSWSRDRTAAVCGLLACVAVLCSSGCKKPQREEPQREEPQREEPPQAKAAPANTRSTADGDKVARLVEALKDSGTRTDALEALDRLGAAAAPAVPALVELLKTVKPFRQRGQIVKVLGAIGADSAPAVPILVQDLGHELWAVRFIAAHALGQIGSAAASAVKPLAKLQKDPDPRVAVLAAIALSRIDPATYVSRSKTPVGAGLEALCQLATKLTSDAALNEAQRRERYAQLVASKPWPGPVVDLIKATGLFAPEERYPLFVALARKEGLGAWSCAALQQLHAPASSGPR